MSRQAHGCPRNRWLNRWLDRINGYHIMQDGHTSKASETSSDTVNKLTNILNKINTTLVKLALRNGHAETQISSSGGR